MRILKTRGELDISLGGEVRPGPAPHTLTLIKTKLADFPILFKKEFRFLIPCLIHLTRNHTLCKGGRTSPLSRYKGVPPRA